MFERLQLGIALYSLKIVFGWYIVAGFTTGFTAMYALDHQSKENEIRAALWGSVTLLGCVVPVCWMLFNFFYAEKHGFSISWWYLFGWGVLVVVGSAAAFYVQRKWTQKFDLFKHRLTLGTLAERDKKTDVRKIREVLPQPIKYNPVEYFDMKKGMFLGLDERRMPIYWPADLPLPHTAIIGKSGSGKGVAAQNIIAQAAQFKHAVIVLDPKNDEWMPHVLYAACKAAGIPYAFVDLRPAAPPQINLFRGADRHQLDELMQAGFSLAEKGDNADFYRLKDRQACAWLAARIKAGDTPASLYEEHGAHLEKTAEGFAGYLREMADIAAVNATEGLDLANVVAHGGIVYVVGSMRNEKVKRLQRMMVIRAIQLAEERDRLGEKLRPVGILMDEFIYHISRAALEALGAARDKGVYCLLAFQGIADLARCPSDLSPEAVQGAVIENTQIKLVYQLQDPTTAEFFAAMTGKIQVDDETRKVEKNIALVETMETERSIRQTERCLIDETMMTTLYKNLGAIIGLQDADPSRLKGEFIMVNSIKVKKDRDAITPKAWPGAQLKEFNPAEIPALPVSPQPANMPPPVDFSLPAIPGEEAAVTNNKDES